VPAANRPKRAVEGLQVTAAERLSQVLDLISGEF
jgi:hypothetical protein